MGKIWNLLKGLFQGALGLVFMGLFFLARIGELYWLWIAIQIGSFKMFVVGLIPPFFSPQHLLEHGH